MAAITLFLTYALLVIVFISIQDKLRGSKTKKGIIYGISFGGLWLFGIIGVSLLFNSPLKHEVITGILDCLTIIMLGWLSGKYFGEDSKEMAAGKKYLSPIFIIGFIYFIGRYISYLLFHIELAYSTKMGATLIWTLCLGMWMGIMYMLLRQSVDKYSLVWKALVFGGGIWNRLAFVQFFRHKVSSLELFIQAGTDIILVMVGILVYEYFKKIISPA